MPSYIVCYCAYRQLDLLSAFPIHRQFLVPLRFCLMTFSKD
jgi:hypothetical protein